MSQILGTASYICASSPYRCLSITRQAISVAGMLDGKPIAVAGHSNGSVLALQTCRTLKNTYNYPPEHFFPMACPAPHVRPTHAQPFPHA